VPDVIAAIDEGGANDLVQDAEAALGTLSDSGSGSLGPFTASWSASATFSGGSADLIAPNTIRLADVRMDYTVSFTFSFDLSSIIPDFCLPQVCVNVPFIGRVCTPRICIDWPTVTIPVSHSSFVKFTADFNPSVTLVGGVWKVDLVIAGVPSLQLGPAAAAIIVAIGAAAALVLLPIPFIGPVLAIAVAAITAAIGVAGVLGLLGPILSPFVTGLRFTVYEQPQVFEILPAAPPDAAVNVTLTAITAAVVSTDEDELVLNVDFSP
jgi:hypothetical protein